MSFLDREVRRLFGKGIHHYGLIENGDRIAVAVSGGKDSMLLLWLLRERLARVPISYELVAVHVDPGFDTETAAGLEEFFKAEGFAYDIIRTDYGLRAHGPENRENPCFLCARLRRSALFRKARELGCRKIALGHNQDDIIETFFINICYGAQVATMMPRQEFFGGEMSVIRPLALVSAGNILKMCSNLESAGNAEHLPVGCEKSQGRNSRHAGGAFQKELQGAWKHLPRNEQCESGIPATTASGPGQAWAVRRAGDAG